ncbi:MAG: hypothetical protein O3A20_00860 [Planctomycetota bacterium]|nr:hypothetical protein [Planctomycetota bacterium]
MLVVLDAIGLYLALGVLIAVPFVARWVHRVDPAAAQGSWGFRLLILPGCALLWPWVLKKMLQVRRDAQRAAMRARRRK